MLGHFEQAIEQSKRYDGLSTHSRNISGQQDLSNFARNTPISASLLRIPKKIFAPPQPPAGEGDESLEYNNVSAWTCGVMTSHEGYEAIN